MLKSILIAAAIVALAVALMPLDPFLLRAIQAILPDSELLRSLAAASEHLLAPEIALGLVILYAVLNRIDRMRRFGIFLGTVASQALLVNVMKDFFGRMRPADSLESFGFHGPWDLGYNSFPGGHAAGALAFATVLSAWHPRFRWLLFAWAGLMILARLYLDRHYVSDCFVGACLGFFVARAFLVRFEPQPAEDAAEPAANPEV